MADFVVIAIGCEECGRPVRIISTESDARSASDRVFQAYADRGTFFGGVPSRCGRVLALQVGAVAIDTMEGGDNELGQHLADHRESGYSDPQNPPPPPEGEPPRE
jgi:hypothetical protein